jgi:hypothetical protein
MSKPTQRKRIEEPSRPQERSTIAYKELANLAGNLSYREKLSLAQRLIQLARQEEEELNPTASQTTKSSKRSPDTELLQYVADRLRKLKPSSKAAIYNSIGAMFQFRGGISEGDKDRLFAELQKRRTIIVEKNGRIQYPEV